MLSALKSVPYILTGCMIMLLAGCGSATIDDGDGDAVTTDQFTLYYDTDGLANNYINDIAVDYIRSGIWVATQKGVSFFSLEDSTWTTYGTEDGFPNLKVTSVAISVNTVWAGTMSGPVSFNGSGWDELSDTGVLPSTYITAIATMPGPDYSIWFGTRDGAAVKSYSGEWVTYTTTDGLSYNDITSIARDNNGKIWVGTLYGLNSYNGSTWTIYTTKLPDTNVYAVYADSFGFLWVGTSSGTAKLEGNSWIKYDTNDGLPSPVVNDFVEDYNHVFWTATDSGVAWFNGVNWIQMSLPTEVEGLQVTSLASDVISRSLWIGTTNGLVRFSLSSE